MLTILFSFPKKQNGLRDGKIASLYAFLLTASLLACAGVGEIEVSSKPQGAEVYLDDSLTGLITNCTLTEVPSGTHTVKVVFGEKKYSEDVDVKNGEKSTVSTQFAEEYDLLWKYDASSAIRNCPAIADDGTIVFSTEEGLVNALSPTGSLKWQKSLGNELASAPTIDPDNNIYVSSNTQVLICLDLEGNVLWQYTDSMPGGRVRASAALDENGTIYVVSDTLVPANFMDTLYPYDCLYAFKKDGTLVKRYDRIAIDMCSSPALSEGILYISDRGNGTQGEVRAVTTDGVVKWRRKYYGAFYASLAIGSNGNIYSGIYTTVYPKLYSISPEGNETWSLLLTTTSCSSPAIGPDGTIYLNTDNGYVNAVDPSSGTFKWSYLHSGAGFIESSPAIGSDGTVYAASSGSDGKFYLLALDPQGSLLWSYEVPQTVPYLTISPDGILYCPSGKSLYAFYVGQGLADSPWPKFQHDAKNTGRYGAQ